MCSATLGGTRPANTSSSVPRLTPLYSASTRTSSGPGSRSAAGQISPWPAAATQKARAPIPAPTSSTSVSALIAATRTTNARSPVEDGPPAPARRQLQPRIRPNHARVADPLQHRQIGVGVAVEVAGGEVGAARVGPRLGA